MSIHLQRRPHTRKGMPMLPQIDEEVEEIQLQKPKRRPRPSPIVTPFQTQSISFDLLKSTQTLAFLDKDPEFSLSPSLLLTRRKSETVLDFPVPPKKETQVTAHASTLPPRYSPTPSVSSKSSTSSYPVTPIMSEEEEERYLEDADVPATSPTTPSSVRRQPCRTTSVLSLRSFGVSEFDAQAAPIYALLRTSPASPPPSAPLPRRPKLRQEVKALRNITSLESFIEDWVDVDSELVRIPRTIPDEVERRPSLILSVEDGSLEGCLEIPFMIDGNFLDIDLSDEDIEDSEDSYFSDIFSNEINELPIAQSTVSAMDGGFASSDEESDDEHRRPSIPSPSRVQDPDLARQAYRRGAIVQPQFFPTPSMTSAPSSSPSTLSAAVPSPAPSTKSSFLSRLAIPPRESIVPRDVDLDDLFSPVEDIEIFVPVLRLQKRSSSPETIPPPKRSQNLTPAVTFISPFASSTLPGDENCYVDATDGSDSDESPPPILRSRFSTSTLNSVPEQPQSPKSALVSPSKFFSRLLRTHPTPSASRHAPLTPPKTLVRNSIQPLKYRKPPHTSHGTAVPRISSSPPGRRPSKSLELYDRPPVTPTCSSPIPFDKERTERYYQYYQKHRVDQRGLSLIAKRYSSRSSLDTTYSMESAMSGSGESITSAGSVSSTGLKRRPIPVELFIKH